MTLMHSSFQETSGRNRRDITDLKHQDMAIRAVSFLRLLVAVWLLCEVFAQRSAGRNNRRLATRNRLRSGEGTCMCWAFIKSYLFKPQFYPKVSNAAKCNIPLKKYLVGRTQLISSVWSICISIAMLAESLRPFLKKSGKWDIIAQGIFFKHGYFQFVRIHSR